jgi:YegS/Rv2252/BmrU family lipid kinase
MTKQKSIVIVNPIAGSSRNRGTEKAIREWLNINHPDCAIEISEYKGHAQIIASRAINEGFNHFIVAGGDGTINEVGTVLYKNKNISLGIIPTGSGNGLALHLRLPNEIIKALEIAFGTKTEPIDVGLLNEKPFFSVAGIGFDAKVAFTFSQKKGRGLRNYVQAVIKDYPAYKPTLYSINANNIELSKKLLMISFANSNQFGNNISLSPYANLSDGLIDICLMSKVPSSVAALISPLLFFKKIHKTQYLKIIRASSATINVQLPAYYHIDGEPFAIQNPQVELKLIPSALKINVK